MIYISYFTQSTPYEQVMKDYLEPSLKKWNLKYDIQELKNEGNWMSNVAMKPKFILDMLNKHSEDVIFLDADAIIKKYPELLNKIPEEYDIALHYLNWRVWYGKNYDKKELLSGTMLLRNNFKVKKLCKEWYKKAVESNQWEQQVLAKILKEREDIKIYELPFEYCTLIDRPGGRPPLVDIKNAIVLHHQVSRNYKNKKL